LAKELKNLVVNEIFERVLFEYGSRHLHDRLIDIGCGTKPYRSMLAPLVSEHIGLDHSGTLHGTEAVDLIGTAYDIPVQDCTFDSAICTAVLEHLEEPEQAIRECYRVLKPGGAAIYSAPFIWHLHEEPRDFFRYSRYGLEYLFKKAGFEILEIRPLSGFWMTFGQMFIYYIYRFNRGPLRWLRLIDVGSLALQRLFYALDRLDRAEAWTWMYVVVVRRPPVEA
jgi:SAM-dependent methyltransferase